MPEVALDKATLVADGLDSHWGESAGDVFRRTMGDLQATHRRGKYPYEDAWSLPDGGYAATAGDGRSVPRFRLEFNPAHDLAETAAFAGLLRDARLTRVDYAVDYPGEDINGYIFERPGVSRQAIYGRGGRLETLYLGRRSSAVMLRCYDKAHEQREPGAKMRTEAQVRYKPGDWLDEGVFDRLWVGRKAVPAGLDVRDEMKLVWAYSTPEWRSRVCSRTRSRIEWLMAEAGATLEPQPGEVLRERWDAVAEAAESLTARCAGGKVCL